MGAVFLDYTNMYGVKFADSIPYDRQVTMLKPYSPKLVNWSNDWDNSFGFQIDKPNLYTGAYTSVMTYDDCLFFVFGVRVMIRIFIGTSETEDRFIEQILVYSLYKHTSTT